jgi:hypothetical protein
MKNNYKFTKNTKRKMNRIILIITAVFINLSFLYSAEPFRTPFITIKVNGKEYQNGSEIKVRSGEKVQVEAKLYGGRRDYCSNPYKYANVGKNTVIESYGENGISFNINQGQFRGVWTLTEETANFSSGADVVITKNSSNGNISRTALVEFKPGNYSKVFFKVNSKTKWHYIRHAPGGIHEEDETYEGIATFYFVIESEPGVWYSSNNIKAKGNEDFSVRTNLDRIQSFYNLIEKDLISKNWSSARNNWNNLKNSLADLKSNIDKAKQKDPKYECEITLIGLPSDLYMQHIKQLNELKTKWIEASKICLDNVQKINSMLLNTQMKFSSNILKSVFKNYINWGTSIPTGSEDLLTIYDPRNVFGPIDMPRKLLGWYEESEKDASILKDQANVIRYLSNLREFYLKRGEGITKETQNLKKIIEELTPVQELHSEMENYLSSNKTVKFQNRN